MKSQLNKLNLSLPILETIGPSLQKIKINTKTKSPVLLQDFAYDKSSISS